MDLITLDYALAERLLDEAVAERGDDFVYSNRFQLSPGLQVCLYVATDADGNDVCGCIIGCAAHKAGVPLSELKMMEGASAVEIIDKFFVIPDGEEGVRVIRLWRVAQIEQDAGQTWGESVRLAKEQSS